MTNELTKTKNIKKRRPYPQKYRDQKAQMIHKSKPWKCSTGPQTDSGKTASARNAYKHGFRSEDMNEIRQLLRHFHDRLKTLTAGHGGENDRYSPE